MGHELIDESLGAGILVLEPRDVRLGEQFFLVLLVFNISKERWIEGRANLGVLQLTRVLGEIPGALRDGERRDEADALGFQSIEQLVTDVVGVADGVQKLPDADVNELLQISEVKHVGNHGNVTLRRVFRDSLPRLGINLR